MMTGMPTPEHAPNARPAGSVLRARARWLVEVLSFVALWAAADLAVRTWHWPVPSGVVGLMALTAVLVMGWLPSRHIERGARWLLGDMLLFFIPPLMALIRHQELFGWMGVKLAIAVAAGTLFVMGGVGWVVERAIRWEDAR
jgi:holin-like protein